MSDDIVQVASGLLPNSIAATISVPSTGINTGTGTITKTAHGRWTGDGCRVTGGGLSATPIYYIGRLTADTLTAPTTFPVISRGKSIASRARST